ncbi:hypothetical protein BB560_003947 [Smittium megazygosporum]|uniref:Uncharacterized protein n=1 Tax=Smittium megazygosporum TaxID=133381 RepID=A0A2T9ZAK4_9FUNG|nr:hypothetical protein BB560_003947 [Smittium megazygosporum]
MMGDHPPTGSGILSVFSIVDNMMDEELTTDISMETIFEQLESLVQASWCIEHRIAKKTQFKTRLTNACELMISFGEYKSSNQLLPSFAGKSLSFSNEELGFLFGFYDDNTDQDEVAKFWSCLENILQTLKVNMEDISDSIEYDDLENVASELLSYFNPYQVELLLSNYIPDLPTSTFNLLQLHAFSYFGSD